MLGHDVGTPPGRAPFAFIDKRSFDLSPHTVIEENNETTLACRLTVAVNPAREASPVMLHYDQRAVTPIVAQMLGGQFAAFLDAFVNYSPSINLSPGSVIHRATKDPVNKPVLARIEAWARRAPDRPAVTDAAGTMTYAELVGRAEALARQLNQRGIGPGKFVGVAVSRTRAYPVAALATWRCGATFLPVDPIHSSNRLAQAQQDGLLDILVAAPATADVVQDHANIVWLDETKANVRGDSPSVAPRADSLAYVMYTSGSTGRAKPVAIQHSNLAAYANGLSAAIGLKPNDRILHTAALGFSSSIRQTIVALANGVHVVVAPAAALSEPIQLLAVALEHSVTVLDLVPSLWRRILAAVGNDRTF